MSDSLDAAKAGLEIARDASACTDRAIKQAESLIVTAQEAIALAQYWQERAMNAEIALIEQRAAVEERHAAAQSDSSKETK